MSTTAGVILLGGGALEVLIPGCGPAGDDDDIASPTATPDVQNGILTLPLATNLALQPVDGFEAFIVNPAGSIIVIHTAASTFVCLSRRCTHQQCTVAYSASGGTLNCPCHGSKFTTTGSVAQGPASTPLHSYATTFDGTNVVVDLNS